MNLRQLKIFRSVMTQGSVSEAARSLGLSQPSVSNVLRHTEETLGVRLFKRVRGRLTPTPEAESLFPDVEQIHDELEAIDGFVQNLRNFGAGTLSLIANPTLAHTLLAPAVAEFHSMMPTVHIRLETNIPARLIADRVLEREFDLGFAYGPNPEAHAVVETLGRSTLVLAIPKDHRLANKSSVSPLDLQGEPIISPGPRAPLRSLAEAAFADVGCELTPIIETSLSAAACAIAQQGAGIAIIDRLLTERDTYPGLAIRPLDTARSVDLELIYSPARPLSLPSKRFLEVLRRICDTVSPRSRRSARA